MKLYIKCTKRNRSKSKNLFAVVAGLIPQRNIIYDTSKVNNVPVDPWQVFFVQVTKATDSTRYSNLILL